MNTTKRPALSALPHIEQNRSMPLTYIQVVKTIAQLGNRCDSDVVSVRRIQRRLVNEGRDVSVEQVQKALTRAVRAGAIAEVVENRYKVMQSKGGQATRPGLSGPTRVLQSRDKRVVVKPRKQQQLAARQQKAGAIKAARQQKAGAIKAGQPLHARGKTAASRPSPKGTAKRSAKPHTPVTAKGAISSRRKLAVSAKQLPVPSAGKRLPGVSRFILAVKGKQLMGSKRPVMVVRAVKSSIKLLARAMARAGGRCKEAATRCSMATAKSQSLVQRGKKQRAERRRRPRVVPTRRAGKESSSNPAAGEPSGRGTEREEQGDSEDTHNNSSAVSSEESLRVEEPPRDEGPCYQQTVSSGYQTVSIFPGWAK